jgi:hypothetical protein
MAEYVRVSVTGSTRDPSCVGWSRANAATGDKGLKHDDPGAWSRSPSRLTSDAVTSGRYLSSSRPTNVRLEHAVATRNNGPGTEQCPRAAKESYHYAT